MLKKKLKFKELIHGWTPDLIKLVLDHTWHAKTWHNKEADTYYGSFRITIDCLVNKFRSRIEPSNENNFIRVDETSRACYGRIEIGKDHPKVVLPIFLLIVLISEEDYLTICKDKIGDLYFNEVCEANNTIPFLNFRIFLLPEQWKLVKECVCTREIIPYDIHIIVKYPTKPAVDLILADRGTYDICHLEILTVCGRNLKQALKNPVFKYFDPL